MTRVFNPCFARYSSQMLFVRVRTTTGFDKPVALKDLRPARLSILDDPTTLSGLFHRSDVLTECVCVGKSEPIEIEATVSQALPNAMFKLRLDNSDKEILGIVSGKMRKHFIRILPGDRVRVELSPYDLTRGRIVFRQK